MSVICHCGGRAPGPAALGQFGACERLPDADIGVALFYPLQRGARGEGAIGSDRHGQAAATAGSMDVRAKLGMGRNIPLNRRCQSRIHFLQQTHNRLNRSPVEHVTDAIRRTVGEGRSIEQLRFHAT
jgi:hypothetical protein